LTGTPSGFAQNAAPQISCKPVAERSGDLGCWIMARQVLSNLPAGPLYWHLDSYPSTPLAEADKGHAGTVIESGGKAWLLTIEQANWRAKGGETRRPASARCRSAKPSNTPPFILRPRCRPAFSAPVHRHAEPEAVFAAGRAELCVETTQGRTIERPGGEGTSSPAVSDGHSRTGNAPIARWW